MEDLSKDVIDSGFKPRNKYTRLAKFIFSAIVGLVILFLLDNIDIAVEEKYKVPKFAFESSVSFIFAIVGYFVPGFFVDQFGKVIQQAIENKVLSVGADSSVFQYLLILQNVPKITDFIKKIAELPQDPDIQKLLVESYSSDAKNSKFHTDVGTSLSIGFEIMKISKEMNVVNTVPPFEWWYPSYLKDEKIKSSIEKYLEELVKEQERRKKSGEKIIIFRRINLVDNINALESVLEYSWQEHKKSRNADISAFSFWLRLLIEDRIESIGGIYKNIASEILSIDKADYANLVQYLDTEKDKYSKLSKAISLKILEDFLLLHSSDSYDAVYVLKDELNSANYPSLLKILNQEEAIYIENDENLKYLVRIEESGIDSVLLTVKKLQSNDDLNYYKFQKTFFNGKNRKSDNTSNSGTLAKIVDKLKAELKT
jgi:hypothetical protein